MPFHLDAAISTVLVLVIGVTVGAIGFWHVYRAIRSLTVRRRFARGAQGEEKARIWLGKHGFRITDAQVDLTAEMLVDGKKAEYTVRADYLVKRKGRIGLVEVKTGTRAIDPASRESRRQIFEYYHLFDVDDFYFFDAENERLMTIQFAGSQAPRMHRAGSWLWGFVSGAGVAVGAWVALRFV